MAKELAPIVLATLLWGHHWAGKAVLFCCDNQAIIYSIQSYSSKEPLVMHLLRCLFMLAACLDFHPMAKHIAGGDNGPADSLSCNFLSSFTQAPAASQLGTPIPPALAALFQHPGMDWTSAAWRQQFLASWQKGLQRRPLEPTRQGSVIT